MSRTKSVSEACAVSAAKPITKATAAGPAFRDREIKLSGTLRVGVEFEFAADSEGYSSFIVTASPCLVRGLKFRAICSLLNGPDVPEKSLKIDTFIIATPS